METRASPFVVGLFTLGVLFGILVFVFWLGRYGETAGRETYQVAFTDAVTGLSRGSAVLYSGIRIGEVTELRIDERDLSRIIATIQVDPQPSIRTDTKAQLQFTGITGVGIIQLWGGSLDAPALDDAWDQPGLPTLMAERSQFQDLMEGAQSLLTRLDAIADTAEALFEGNREAVGATIRNLETFTGALAENSDEIATFLADAGSAARRLDTLGMRLETLSEDLSGIVSAIAPEDVEQIVTDVRGFTARLDATSEQLSRLVSGNEEALANTIRNAEIFSAALAENADGISSFMADAGAAARRLDSVGERIEALSQRAEEVMAAVEPDTVRSILADAESFASRLDETSQRLAGFIEANETALSNTINNAEIFSSALADNSKQLTSLMADAASAAQRLDSVGERLDGLVQRADEVVAAVEPDAVRQIVEDARGFSDMLAANSDSIAALAQNAGSAADRLNRLAGDLEGVGENVARVISAVDPDRVARSVENVESFTAALAERRDDFESFMDDASAVAANLRQSTSRLDGLLDRVDGMVGEDGEGFIGEIASAARAFRELSENLDERLAGLTGDLQRLGGGSLREFQAFVSQGRRTLGNLERVITNLERDPSRLLFGGSPTPEYNPGRRF